ncbi:hypothetical protein [Prochlorococcus marinus]|uniref:hypothetical protein n=1 Tax=Prochlorococcus marinus TaxID=1219 RepID=UPI001ADB9767|nr:hypothetical protein [Prochlorococcus marinus]MBO8204855.1 hypothetical protein [Prochlorococcus marinus CUG1415]MBW3044128.1 hypothetical protein [Prochlorococcus marinus str. MU1415]
MKKIQSELPVFYETAHAELASALEMLAACKATESPKQAFGYFMHAKDEFNHAKSFFEMLSKRGKRASLETARNFRFTPPSLITKGYISNKGFLIDTMKLKDFIAFVYTNELLARSSFENILTLVGQITDEGKIISNIMADELRHHGMAKKYFLNHYPALQPWQLMIYRMRETVNNKARKIYDANLKFLDRLLTPIYESMAYLAGTIARKLNLNEFKREGKNLMNISSNSIL